MLITVYSRTTLQQPDFWPVFFFAWTAEVTHVNDKKKKETYTLQHRTDSHMQLSVFFFSNNVTTCLF